MVNRFSNHKCLLFTVWSKLYWWHCVDYVRCLWMLQSQVNRNKTSVYSNRFLAKRHRKLLYNKPCESELAILISEISRVRRVHISRVKQFDNPNIYLCRQCQSLLKNKKKTRGWSFTSFQDHWKWTTFNATAQTASLPESGTVRNVPPHADVIVSSPNSQVSHCIHVFVGTDSW